MTDPGSHAVRTALARFIQASVDAFPQLTDPFDPSWRSPCETGAPQPAPGGGELLVPWQPLARPQADADDLFEPLAQALEVAIHPDIAAYYAAYYAGGLEAESPDGPVSLILIWNEADTHRLIENLLGHALAKQRLRAPYSLFFACTDPASDEFLSVENHTGHVVLERPGYLPERTVAPSLAAFLDTLSPAPPERHPERAAFLARHQAAPA